MLEKNFLRELLEAAIEKQKCNKNTEAKTLYEKFFKQNSREIACNVNLANLYIKENRFNEAEKLFLHTIEIHPNNEIAYLNYCNHLLNQKKIKEALEIIKKACSRCPLSTNILRFQILVMYKQQNYQSAINYLNDSKTLISDDINLLILELNTLFKLKHHDVLNHKIKNIVKIKNKAIINTIIIESLNLGNINLSIKIAEETFFNDASNEVIGATLMGLYVDADLHEKAINLGNKFNLEDITNDKILTNLGVAYQRKGNLSESIKFTRKSIKLNYNSAESHLNLGALYREVGNINEAKKEILLALEINPDIKDGYLNLSCIHQDLQEIELAYKFIQKALNKKESCSKTYLNAANILQCKGDNKLAKELLIKSIKINNREYRAYFLLSLFKEDKLLNELESDFLSFKEESIDSEISKIDFLFAKSNIYHKRKNYLLAAKYLTKANHLKLKIYPSDKDFYLNLSKKISYINLDDNKIIQDANKLENIFIIGMPRCGSTLLESIIGTKEEIKCLGESLRVEESFNKFISDQNSIFLDNKFYCSDKILLDKQLYNYMYIDFIYSKIKNSKIIHLLRDPLDNLLSIYRAHFVRANRYSSSIEDCLEIFLNHLEITNYYKKKFDNFIYTIKYEELVQSPKNEIKKLTNWLGFEWSDNFLNHQNLSRIINTASRMQVREKINTKSINSWENYSKFLNTSFLSKKSFIKIKDIMKEN